MSARTYICIACRWSRRAEAAYGLNTSLRCPTCNGALWELEWQWRIPRKTDDRGWKELAAKVSRDAAVIVPRRQRVGAATVAKLDEQIATVEKQRDPNGKPPNSKSFVVNAPKPSNDTPNKSLQRTRPSRHGCNPNVSQAGALRLVR